MIPNHFPSPEGFKGSIVPLQAVDLHYLKPILETWIVDRDTGEPLPLEVEGYLRRMGNSIYDSNGYSYIVAINEDGEAIGVMGIRAPEEKMMEYASTSYPSELVNAYVSQDYIKKKGIGRALVNALVELATVMGHTEIILNSGPRYEDSWAFYDNVFGPRVNTAIGMYPDKNGEGGDAPIWRKLL